MSEDVRLDPVPGTLECAECGEAIETGYLPVTEAGGDYEPLAGAALCGACGFTEVGMNGCAPRPADVDADALARVEVGDGVTVTGLTDG